jgi:hypothetical protein
MSPDDVCRMAQALARNCGYAVFPCNDDKRPTLKDWPNRAASDAATIETLFRNHYGPLIAVVCGRRSGVSVLDVDQKHPEGVAWWQETHSLLLPTRTFRTRSGGLHLFMRHRSGVKNTQAKIAPGVDTRGDGGFVIYWFATGLECLDQSSPAEWPSWLLAEIAPAPASKRVYQTAATDTGRAVDGILRRLRNARDGERNGVLFWAACRLDELHRPPSEMEALLLPICGEIGLLAPDEIKKTYGSIRSAIGRAAHER